jgi:peptide/nickel transport system permease protein
MLVERALFGVVTLFVVSLVVLLATHALPGDAARAILGREATPERLAALREQLHLGGSLPSQYLHWLGSLLRLDLGTSLAANQPVTTLMVPALVNSSVLMLCAAVVANTSPAPAPTSAPTPRPTSTPSPANSPHAPVKP